MREFAPHTILQKNARKEVWGTEERTRATGIAEEKLEEIWKYGGVMNIGEGE
jgi:hypothetical protein